MTMVEIGAEPLDDAVLNGLTMDERHLVLPDGEWIRAVRRRCEREDLFVYFHRETGKFVVAQWLSKEPRMCQELDTMDLPPDRGGWISLRMMELRCRPFYEHMRDIQDRIRFQRGQKRRHQVESALQKRDSAQYLRRHGKGEAADLLERGSGYIGDEQGGDSLAEKKEDLQRMASGRVITHG